MLRNILVMLIIFTCSDAFSGYTYSPPTVTSTGSGKYSSDKFYAGINWAFGAGQSLGPEVVAGFRSTRVKPGSVNGHAIEFSFPLSQGFQFGAVKLKAINGSRHLQGELGLGYSFLTGTPLITGGAFGSHIMLGTDYILGTGFRPYAGFNTIGAYRKPSSGQTTSGCPAGYLLAEWNQMCYWPG